MSAKFPSRNVAEALERSLKNADLKAVNSAVVAAARVLAERIDYLTFSGFVDENGKLDNVSLPTFLKYCRVSALRWMLRLRLVGLRKRSLSRRPRSQRAARLSRWTSS